MQRGQQIPTCHGTSSHFSAVVLFGTACPSLRPGFLSFRADFVLLLTNVPCSRVRYCRALGRRVGIVSKPFCHNFATKHRACLSTFYYTAPGRRLCKKKTKERDIPDLLCQLAASRISTPRLVSLYPRVVRPGWLRARYRRSRVRCWYFFKLCLFRESRNDTTHGVRGLITMVHFNLGICAPCFAATSAVTNPQFSSLPLCNPPVS